MRDYEYRQLKAVAENIAGFILGLLVCYIIDLLTQ